MNAFITGARFWWKRIRNWCQSFNIISSSHSPATFLLFSLRFPFMFLFSHIFFLSFFITFFHNLYSTEIWWEDIYMCEYIYDNLIEPEWTKSYLISHYWALSRQCLNGFCFQQLYAETITWTSVLIATWKICFQ